MNLLRLLPLVPVALLAACGGATTSEIRASDGAVIPALRAAFDLGGNEETPRSQPHAGHAIEVGLAGARGKDTQQLNTGDLPVKFGGQTFASPQTLHHEFRVGYAEALYRYRWVFGDSGNFGLEVLGGLGHAGLDLKVTGATQSATENLGNTGLVFGGGIVGRLTSTLSLQGRISIFGSGRQEGVTGISRYDLFLAQALGNNAAVRGGFSSWTVRSGREADDATTSSNSPITIRFAGPTIGFELMF